MAEVGLDQNFLSVAALPVPPLTAIVRELPSTHFTVLLEPDRRLAMGEFVFRVHPADLDRVVAALQGSDRGYEIEHLSGVTYIRTNGPEASAVALVSTVAPRALRIPPLARQHVTTSAAEHTPGMDAARCHPHPRP